MVLVVVSHYMLHTTARSHSLTDIVRLSLSPPALVLCCTSTCIPPYHWSSRYHWAGLHQPGGRTQLSRSRLVSIWLYWMWVSQSPADLDRPLHPRSDLRSVWPRHVRARPPITSHQTRGWRRRSPGASQRGRQSWYTLTLISRLRGCSVVQLPSSGIYYLLTTVHLHIVLVILLTNYCTPSHCPGHTTH